MQNNTEREAQLQGLQQLHDELAPKDDIQKRIFDCGYNSYKCIKTPFGLVYLFGGNIEMEYNITPGHWQEDTDEARTFFAITPGATSKDINVELVDNNLIITGKWSVANKQARLYTRIHTNYQNGGDISATVENGVLTVIVPITYFHKKTTIPVG